MKAGTLDVLATGSAKSPTLVVQDTVPSLVDSALYLAVLEARLGAAGLPPAAISSPMAFVPRQSVQPPAPANPVPTQDVLAGLAVGILLFVAVGQYGGLVAQGVVEEEATRMIDPTTPLTTLLSLLPPFAPVLMAVRIATSDVPFWQIGLALVLSVASIVGMTWLAGRIYANAALRSGMRMRFREALDGR